MSSCSFFDVSDATPTETHALSLHDALPISLLRTEGAPVREHDREHPDHAVLRDERKARVRLEPDRKSTRLNSSHLGISYAVFCLKKKTRAKQRPNRH